ncbi:hypothetical protein [Frateuria defendens]|uniref:hypothetical protein n=1 Tax=Frateuria defendens TaxID=2219559 RepID=UPI00066FBB27|nr:hypothetical protein [Frateuria defendens]
MTPLDRTLRRQITVDGKDYTVRLDPLGLRITERGRRKGLSLSWQALVNGDAALAAALHASLEEDTAAPS